MAIHTDAQRLDPAQQKIAVKRADDGANAVLDEGEVFCNFVAVGNSQAANDIAVAAQVLGRRVNDDVSAK